MQEDTMEVRNHYDGFPNEHKFHMILDQAMNDCPTIKARVVRRIIAHFDRDFVRDLFVCRPCVRKLRYIGCGCAEIECPHGNGFFRNGGLYESIDFNGGTYSIRGYEDGKKRIGFAYFNYVGDVPTAEWG